MPRRRPTCQKTFAVPARPLPVAKMSTPFETRHQIGEGNAAQEVTDQRRREHAGDQGQKIVEKHQKRIQPVGSSKKIMRSARCRY